MVNGKIYLPNVLFCIAEHKMISKVINCQRIFIIIKITVGVVAVKKIVAVIPEITTFAHAITAFAKFNVKVRVGFIYSTAQKFLQKRNPFPSSFITTALSPL